MTKDQSRELINKLNAISPKFSKITLCMVRNPQYGVRLTSEMQKVYNNYLMEIGELRRHPGAISSKPKKRNITVAVDEDVYDKIYRLKKEQSINEFMKQMIERSIDD